jgi:hypothetical protein
MFYQSGGGYHGCVVCGVQIFDRFGKDDVGVFGVFVVVGIFSQSGVG